MESFTFTEENKFSDLTIETADNKELYVSKFFLAGLSIYFKKMLTDGFVETNSSTIKLEFRAKILDILFRYCFYSFQGKDFVEEHCYETLDSVDDICDFFHATNQFLLTKVKSNAEDYFSSELQIISLYSTEFIEMVQLLELNKIQKNIIASLTNKNLSVSTLDYTKMQCKTLHFFSSNKLFFRDSLCLWMEKHNPTDADLTDADIFRYNFTKFPTDYIEKLMRCVRKLENAPKFRAKVTEQLSYALYPDSENKN